MIQRTHDKIVYLKENRYDQPKEIFKILFARARQSGVLRCGSVVSDFGCAAGEFLYYLRGSSPSANYYGYDVIPELLEKAKEKVPGIEFRFGSVLDKTLLPPASVDVAFMTGVLSIFDEFETPLANLLSWTKKGGAIYITSPFNSYPVDVWVRYRLADDPVPEHREPGWNIFSKVSLSRFLNAMVGRDKYTFMPFEMPCDLVPNPQDPLRTWTFQDSQGRRLLTNGLSLICQNEILEIRP